MRSVTTSKGREEQKVSEKWKFTLKVWSFLARTFRDIIKRPVMEAQGILSKRGKGVLKAVNAL